MAGVFRARRFTVRDAVTLTYSRYLPSLTVPWITGIMFYREGE
jgi:hypothetical protein